MKPMLNMLECVRVCETTSTGKFLILLAPFAEVQLDAFTKKVPDSRELIMAFLSAEQVDRENIGFRRVAKAHRLMCKFG